MFSTVIPVCRDACGQGISEAAGEVRNENLRYLAGGFQLPGISR